MSLYFNENDRFPAAWLRQLWPDATVDERSIVEVQPADVASFTRAHFFGGIGGWQYALELAGWPATRPVWTGSCPCQPFSIAGRKAGAADARHLWPEFHRLISEAKPPVVIGEQVASRAGRDWLTGVRADLEALGYEVGCADLCAASLASPHIRQRLFWVGVANGSGPQQGEQAPTSTRHWGAAIPTSRIERVANSSGTGTGGDAGTVGLLGPANQGHWSNYELISCGDGKTRRVEPSILPLVDGLPKGVVRSRDQGAPIDANATSEARVGRLRGYGNAIVPQLAAVFIRAFLDTQKP